MLNENKFFEMIEDTRCRENKTRPIDKNQCRNNCSQYNGKKCILDYWRKPDKKEDEK